MPDDNPCAYAPRLGESVCHAPVTLHVAVYDHHHDEVNVLLSCSTHAPTVRASGQFIEEHAYEAACGAEAALWADGNCCVAVPASPAGGGEK